MRARRVFAATAGAVCLGIAALARPALAEREPVLKQIKLPHPYYYREMYLPQVTSGPSAVDWSPDGREVVLSMQGSLWRLRLETSVATQMTNGPGYDFQPDWSPDGRFVAYASYRADAIELRLLEVATGTTRPITANGAVNVEPRWSPDGRRIAFVSTLDQGRFHVHVVDLGADGDPGGIVELTGDNDSGLSRYYYSVFDHYLSPTWSPDGSEIILVSNRGHIHGTGGFYRMKARPGARMREIRYEETTWKARPDWSPDGRRVVYASYLGRPWHQIWLMTDEGGDPFPISYGDFDATSPRWSPDGRRIAYIVNEGGDTGLVIQEIPGGRRQRVTIAERRYLGPVGRLTIVVEERGRPTPARVSVTAADGRGFAPDDAWRHADDSFDRSERQFEYTYFHTPGRATVVVPPGIVKVEVLKGLEHRVFRSEVKIPAGGAITVRAPLARIADLQAEGWRSGDQHVHMNYCGAYRNDPAHLAFQARAEDLQVVENLIVNKEQRFPDIAYFSGKPDPVSTGSLLILHDQEYHTSYWGHSALLGLRENILLPGYAGYVNTAAGSLYPENAAIFDLAHAQGAITGYVHPFDSPPDPFKTGVPLHHELPVDAALGKVDYMEIVGFSDHLATAEVWYRLLDCGFRIPAGAGTDAMADFASLRGPVGLNRLYVKTGAPLDRRHWIEGIKQGRTFATNGPLLRFSLDDKEVGDTLDLPAGRHQARVRAELRSMVPVDHLEIVGNGEVVKTLPLTGDRTVATYTGALAVDRSGWYTLRAWSRRATSPILDIYPFATTSPIYVRLGGAPPRPSRADTEFFIAWIDRLIEDVGASTAWNSDAEKSEVLRMIEDARGVYRRLAATGS